MRAWPAHSHHGGQSYKEHKLRVSETKEAVTSPSRQNSLLTSTKLQLSNHLQTQSSPASPKAKQSNCSSSVQQNGKKQAKRPTKNCEAKNNRPLIRRLDQNIRMISRPEHSVQFRCSLHSEWPKSVSGALAEVWNLSQKVWISNEICGSYWLLSSPFKTNVALKTFQELHASLLPKDGALQRDGWGVPSSVVSQVRSLLGEPSPRYLSMLNLGYLLAKMTTCVYGV